MNEQLANHIQQIINITENEKTTILSYFKPLTVKKRALLLTHGQQSQRNFFVCKGCVRIYFLNEDGQEATRYLAFENQFATALVSFITTEPSEEFVEALPNTELLYITHHHFHQLLSIVPQWEKFYRNYLEGAYVKNTRRLMSFITMDAHERYQQLLTENPEVVQRLPNKLVASYLNISQETLSRLKSKRK